MSRVVLAGAVVCLLVVAAGGCEQLLDAGAYKERTTEPTGSGGSGGAAGSTTTATTDTTTAASTSAGPTNDCYSERDVVLLEDDHVVAGHQGRCSTAQLAEIASCWLNGDPACATFFGDSTNEDCRDCVRGTPASTIIPAQLTAFGLSYYYTQVIACAMVVQDKPDCLAAVQLELCRVTACEACYAEDPEYYDCMDYAVGAGCSGIALPPACESLFTELSPECYAPTVEERAVKTATVLCGP
jgi:hypothetical protein